MNAMKVLLVLTILVLSVVDNLVVAQNNCYVCSWTDGTGEIDICSDTNFTRNYNPWEYTIPTVPCGDNFCYWYTTEATGFLPATAVRGCDLDMGGSGSFCSTAGTNPGPGGLFDIECCKGNFCNSPLRTSSEGGGGGGDVGGGGVDGGADGGGGGDVAGGGDGGVVAHSSCYVCTWTNGAGEIDTCSDANFDPSSSFVQTVPCSDSFCYWYTTEANGFLPATVVRSCDLDIGGSGSFCSTTGPNPGPGGRFDVECCKGDLCNAAGDGGGGGGGIVDGGGDGGVEAQSSCYVCSWTDGLGETDACSDAYFDPSSSLVQTVSCGDSFCYWYTTQANGFLPATAVRSCDLDIGGSGSFCSTAGTNPGPGGLFDIECCKGDLCNAAGGSGGGGDGGVVAQSSCYVCSWIDGTGLDDVCSDGNFDPSSLLVTTVPCDAFCVTLITEENGFLPASVTRKCNNLGTGSVNVPSVCSAAGKGPGPGGIGEVDCCKGDLCNAPGAGGGGGDDQRTPTSKSSGIGGGYDPVTSTSSASGIIMNVSACLTTSVLTIWTASKL